MGREKKKLARQAASATNKRLPTASAPSKGKRVGASADPPEPIDNKPFTWSVSDIDHEYDGKWNWDLAPKETADLLDLLEQMAKLTWREVKDQKTNSKNRTRARHHHQPADSICQDAQQRLSDLQLDVETVFRLRHGNLVRVWGYLQGAIFNIVWYDRLHQVCPTED